MLVGLRDPLEAVSSSYAFELSHLSAAHPQSGPTYLHNSSDSVKQLRSNMRRSAPSIESTASAC